jgi:hypothetical protein
VKKSLALTAGIAALATIAGGAGVASATSRPSIGNATITSDLSGTPATYVETVLVPGSVSGDITLGVSQGSAWANGGWIVMADIDLGSGFSIDSVGSVTVVSDEYTGGGSCSGTAVIEADGDDVTAKGFACNDADADGFVEFSLVVDDLVASTTITEVGSFEAESQYRTNSSRRVKAQSWVTENELAITLAESVD